MTVIIDIKGILLLLYYVIIMKSDSDTIFYMLILHKLTNIQLINCVKCICNKPGLNFNRVLLKS